jgi:predicted NACHT family NTPase
VEEANRVPVYFPRGARLDRIRVRVRVSAERQTFDPNQAREREQARRHGIADEEDAQRVYRHRHGSDETEREPEQPKVEVLGWDEKVRPTIRRGVVVGDPGLGKTWLLKWEAARHAAEAASRLRATGELGGVVLPIYRRQTDVAAALHTLEERCKHSADAPPATLPDAVVESLRARWSERVLNLLRERLGTEQAVLLLDAFDEVPPERRAVLRQALHDWVPGTPQARVLFTSRVVGYEPPWPIAGCSETEREMELLPFDDAQTEAFVDGFFAGEPPAGRELHELLRRAPQLRGMARVPLLLGFLCALHREEWQKPPGQRRDVTRLRRTDLYRKVLERLMRGVWKDLPRPVNRHEVDDKLELLEGVAFRLFAAGKEQFTSRELREAAARAAHARLYPGQHLDHTELTRRMRQWSEEDGLLVEAGAGDDPPYLFLHLTFQEFLAARHLAQHINNHGWTKPLPLGEEGKGAPAQDFVDRMAWLPAWQEVIVLLAGNLDDPLPLLEILADESKDDLFRHRLAVAALCLPEIKALMEAP